MRIRIVAKFAVEHPQDLSSFGTCSFNVLGPAKIRGQQQAQIFVALNYLQWLVIKGDG